MPVLGYASIITDLLRVSLQFELKFFESSFAKSNFSFWCRFVAVVSRYCSLSIFICVNCASSKKLKFKNTNSKLILLLIGFKKVGTVIRKKNKGKKYLQEYLSEMHPIQR